MCLGRQEAAEEVPEPAEEVSDVKMVTWWLSLMGFRIPK